MYFFDVFSDLRQPALFGSGIFLGAYTSASFQLLIDGAFQEVPFKKIEIHHPCQVPELPIYFNAI